MAVLGWAGLGFHQLAPILAQAPSCTMQLWLALAQAVACSINRNYQTSGLFERFQLVQTHNECQHIFRNLVLISHQFSNSLILDSLSQPSVKLKPQPFSTENFNI